MSKVVTPKTLLEELIEVLSQPISFKFYETKFQKVLLGATILFLITGIIIGILINWIRLPAWVGQVGLLMLLGAIIGSVLFQISVIGPELVKLRHTEKTLLDPVIRNFDNEVDRIAQLSKNFQQHHLEYAQARVSLATSHLRSRIALTVGALEKVGVVPLVVVAYFSLRKIVMPGEYKSLSDSMVIFSGLEWILVVLISLYLLSVHMIIVCQRLDQMSLALKHAVMFRSGNSSSENL